MKFLIEILKGIAIGAGAILPGISSGVLCVIFNIYEKLVNSILNFFKDTRKNLIFLFPIMLGIGIGIIIFSKLIIYLFENYQNQTKSIFTGLILGCLPTLLKKANSQKGFKLHYLLFMSITFLIGISSIFLEKFLSNNINYESNILYLISSGFFMSAGVVIPRCK